MAAVKPELGSRWRHYKGAVYIVVGFSRCEANHGSCNVLYIGDREFIAYTKAEVDPWDRPLDEWNGVTLPEGAMVTVCRYEQLSTPEK